MKSMLMTAFRAVAQTYANSLRDPPLWMTGGAQSWAGQTVNESTAMGLSAVYACNKIIAEDISSLPFKAYERLSPRGKRPATEHPSYVIANEQPNPQMSAMVMREAQFHHALLTGNSYAWIEFSRSMKVKAIWLLRPDRTEKKQHEDGSYKFHVRTEDGQEDVFEEWEVIHVHGLGWDGLSGYNVVHMARQTIGLALALEQGNASFWSNGARPGGYIEVPKRMSDPAYERLKKGWEGRHQGSANAHRMAILEEGAKWNEVGMPLKDAEFMQSRKFSIAEVARWYRMQLHKLAELDRATFSNIEHQSIEHVTDTLRPWIVRYEQEYNRKVYGVGSRFFAEHTVDGLLRGDSEKRSLLYAAGRQWGWLSADDIRETENMNPLDDGQGDIYLTPTNMTTTTTTAPADAVRAVEGILAEALQRCQRKEAKVVARSIAKQAGYADFYSTHDAYIRDALRPAVEAARALGADVDVEEQLAVYSMSVRDAASERSAFMTGEDIERQINSHNVAVEVRVIARSLFDLEDADVEEES